MKRHSFLNLLVSVAALGGSVFVTGCASRQPSTSAGLGSQMPMQPGADPGTLVYKSPNIEMLKYHGILIEPADIYHGADANFDGVSDEDQQKLAAFMTSEFKRVLGEKLNVVNEPGPGIVKLQLTLAGITESRPAASTLLRLTPIGAGLTAVKSIADRPASFTGSVTIAGEVTDSETGAVLAGFVAKESPQAYDLTSGLGKIRAAELGCTRGAEEFRDAIVRMKMQAAAQAMGQAPTP